MEWTVYERDFFFRPQDADVEVIWCCLEKRKYAKQLWQSHQSEKLVSKLMDEIETPRAWRFWPLTKDCEIFFASRHALVRWNEIEELASLDLLRGGFAPNRLFSSTDDLQELVEECREQIEKLALMMKFPQAERSWRSVQWPWGTHTELRNLIRSMGVLVRQPQHENHAWEYAIKPGFPAHIYFGARWPNHAAIPKATFHQPFFDCLSKHFPVECEKLVLYNSAGAERKEFWPTVDMLSAMPTVHEKLEALLTWRDFLRDKIPAAQIDELLRPFC